MKPKRKWKRWALLLLLIGVLYYLGVFSLPLRMTRENTGLTSLPAGVDVPIRADKKGVDYVKAYEILFPQVSEITEENAWRDVVRELGQNVFCYPPHFTIIDLSDLVERCCYSREDYWREYCRRMALDTAEVKTPDGQPLFSPWDLEEKYAEQWLEMIKEEAEPGADILPAMEDFARQHGLRQPVWEPENEGDSLRHYELNSLARSLHGELFYEVGWSREAYPEMAAWVDTHSPTLDVVAAAVRKPRYFLPFFKKADTQPLLHREDGDLYFHSLAAEGFALRCAMRLKAGDVEKALSDLESLFRMTAHMQQMPGTDPQLTGANAGYHAARLTRGLLRRGIATDEQLARLASMIDSLPVPVPFRDSIMVDDWKVYELLGKTVPLNPDAPVTKFAFLLAPNTAVKRYAALSEMRFDEHQRAKMIKMCFRNNTSWYARLATARSQALAEFVFICDDSGIAYTYSGVRRQEQRFFMTRLAIALKRYKMEKEAYPENLAALAPEYVAAATPPEPEIAYLFDLFSPSVTHTVKYVRDGDGFTLYTVEEDTDPGQMLRENEWRQGEYSIRMEE